MCYQDRDRRIIVGCCERDIFFQSSLVLSSMKSNAKPHPRARRIFHHQHIQPIDLPSLLYYREPDAIMSILRPHPRRLPIRLSHRTFCTTPSRATSLHIDRNNSDAVADTVPEYPYGPARWYKQSNKGLYGGQRIQFGNNVSGDFNAKTRRTFQVNVHRKRLWSHALDRMIQVRVSARTLRTIDRVGGLDEYLLGEKEARIKQLGVTGWWLRWAIMQQPTIKARFARERWQLGLASKEAYERQLKELEAANISAEAEEAPWAVPKDEIDAVPEMEAEAAVEAEPSTTMEAAESTETSSDPNQFFAVESPPDLPRLTFRVDERTQFVLTPSGWRRLRHHRSEARKQEFIAQHRDKYVDQRMATFTAELAKVKAKTPEMTLTEEREILNAARRNYEKDLWARAEWQVEGKIEMLEEKKEKRKHGRRRHAAHIQEQKAEGRRIRLQRPRRREERAARAERGDLDAADALQTQSQAPAE